MTVRRQVLALFAAAAIFFAAGCGGGDSVPLAVETDEQLYVQGLQLKKLTRNSEALVSFLKLIEKRGEQASAESHFEAGLIFLTHNKDYIEAIHHFQKYLALKPNSPQAPHVRDLINTAKREFARSLPARPPDEPTSVRLEASVEIDQLRRENAELKAALATLQGGGATLVNRTPRGLLQTDPARSPARPAPAVEDSPLSLAPPRAAVNSRSFLPPTTQPAVTRGTPPAAAAPAGRRYRVQQGDSLFAIARKYDAVNTTKKVAEIAAANPGLFPNVNVNVSLKAGTELRIP